MESCKLYSVFDGVVFPSLYKRIYTQEIKMLISNKCSLACMYCAVDTKAEAAYSLNCSGEVIDYLNNKLGKEIYGSTVITFHSGEPLLFLDVIEEVCRKLPREKFVPFITTSGHLLTETNLKKLNALDLRVAVSHDGPNSVITRGYDVIEDKKSLLTKINQFAGFSSVQTEYSWNLYELQDYYKREFSDPRFQKFTLHRVRQRNGNYSLGDFDREKLDAMWRNIVKAILHSPDPLHTVEFSWIKHELDQYLFYQANPAFLSSPLKENKELRATLDLDGNWYYSWFYPSKIGTIHSSLEELTTNFRKLLPQYWCYCNDLDCPARTICNEGFAGEGKSDNLCDYIKKICGNLAPLFKTDIIAEYLLRNYVYNTTVVRC